jgi:uncharacterized protein YjbI with pentapeptide repeats
VLASVAVLFVLAIVFYLPEAFIGHRGLPLSPKDKLDAEASIRGAIIQLFGGFVLIAGLYFTARGFQLTREGHLTDRYSQAIEHIGHDKMDVRIGGIYELERLTRDSAADAGTVIDVLIAFVREHTKSGHRTPSKEKVTADIQVALKVIGRRVSLSDGHGRLDFYFSGLNDADLSNGSFEEAMFYYSSLEDAHFSNSKLNGAGLSFCRAERAAFTGCVARNANFVNAKYVNCWFLHADLTNADFFGCDLSGSDFGRRYQELGDPPFPPATLTNARFTKAILMGTNLRGCDLSTVRGLTSDQLSKAITDENTILPTRWRSAEDFD